MDELDFAESLSDGSWSRLARDYAKKGNFLKQAGLETAASFVRANKAPIAGAVAAGALGTGLQYALNKPSKGKPSWQQRAARASLTAFENADEKQQGFSARMGRAAARAASDVADVMADHPVKGALLALGPSALAGIRLARKLKG